MRDYIPGLILAMAVIAIVALLLKQGASVIDLSPQAASEITARVEAQEETERARIATEADTEQQRIAGRNAGTRNLMLLGGAIAVCALIGYGLYTWGRVEEVRATVQPTIPAHLLAQALVLLAEKPGRDVEMIDGDWWVVDDAERARYPLSLPAPRQSGREA